MIPVERSSFNSEGKPFIEKRIGVPPDTESGKETDFQGDNHKPTGHLNGAEVWDGVYIFHLLLLLKHFH